jgi:hypothetical protein
MVSHSGKTAAPCPKITPPDTGGMPQVIQFRFKFPDNRLEAFELDAAMTPSASRPGAGGAAAPGPGKAFEWAWAKCKSMPPGFSPQAWTGDPARHIRINQ